jgi:FlaA1/EpsC-like NDP-sugar epimerase
MHTLFHGSRLAGKRPLFTKKYYKVISNQRNLATIFAQVSCELMSKNRVYYITIAVDIALINLAFGLSYLARYEWQWLREVIAPATYAEYFPQQILLNILLIVTFVQARVWRRRRGEFWVDEVSRIIYATSAGIFLMGVVTFFVQPVPFSRLLLIWALLFIVVFISLARLVRRFVLNLLYERGIAVDRVLVISSGEVGRSVIRTLLARPDLGYKAIGYLHDGHRENNIGLGRIPHLGLYTDLENILKKNPGLHTVFIALPGEMNRDITRLLRVCHKYNVRPQVVPRFAAIEFEPSRI